MRALLLTVLLFILIGLQYASAQSFGAYIIKEYNTENGLPANGIKGIAFDKETNFLWIATEAGLLRFNGQEFKVFTPRNLPQLSSERIAGLAANKKGEIVFIDTKTNTFRIDKNKPVLYKAHDTTSALNYNRVLFYKLANPVLAGKVALMKSTSQANIYNTIVEINDTACLFTNNENAILYFAISKNKADTIKPKSSYTHTLFETDSQPFFLDGNGHFYQINYSTKKTAQIVLKHQQKSFTANELKGALLIWENNNQKPLLFLGKDAYYLAYDGKHLQAHLICNAIPNGYKIRYALYNAESKYLFIGTQSKGIMIIQPNYFKSLKNPVNNSSVPNAVYAQLELGNRQVLTNNGILLKESTGAAIPNPIQKPIGLSTYVFNDSILFFSALHTVTKGNVLHSYNFKTGKSIHYPKIRINTTFGAVLSNNKLYLATSYGLGMLQGDSLKVLVQPQAGTLTGISPIQMQETAPGKFLLTSCNGLISFDANRKTTDTLLYLPGNCFRTIQKIDSFFFIGTYGAGYFIYKDGILKPMPLDKEKYLLYAHCFLPDKNGFCWISTNRGLFKASLADLKRVYTDNNTAVFYEYFGKRDGIEMTELNGGCTPCALELQDGTLSFPSMDGILWVHPDNINSLPSGSGVFIDEVIADDATYASGFENLVLPAGTNSITVKLSYNGWGNKENIYFDYRIGKNGMYKPVKIENGAIIQLDNLPAGDYTITLRKLIGYGKDNYAYENLQFVIEKHWYNRWWFYLLCALAMLGGVRIYLWYKTKNLEFKRIALEKQIAEKTQILHQKNLALEKSNSLQTRLISIISHDIITPLKFMAVGGKELIEKHAIMPESLKQETIEEITNTAQELQLLSTNIMNWMKYQNENRKHVKERFNLHDASNQVAGVLKSIAKQKDIPVMNHVPDDFIIFQYYEPLKILLYNLISNAINFSNAGTIVIEAKWMGNETHLSVEDHGMGMTQDQIKNILSDEFIISSANIDNRKGNGLGYLIIKDLVKMMEADISIDSVKGKGTRVSVRFPAAFVG